LTWYDIKAQLVDAMGTSTDALHLPFGLLAYFFFACVLSRRHLGPLWALGLILALQIFNEVLDARDWWHWTGTIKWSEAWTDTLATLALPTVIAVAWLMWRRAKT